MTTPRVTHTPPHSSRRGRRFRRAAAPLLGLGLLAAACTTDDPGASPVTGISEHDVRNGTANGDGTQTNTNGSPGSNDGIVLVGLSTFNSCDDLLARLKAEALEQVGPYGLGPGVYPIGFATRMTAEDGAVAATTEGPATTTANMEGTGAAPDMSAGTDTDASASTTNNQEAGVDEADLVKTDGRRIVTMAGQKLRVLDVASNSFTLETELSDDFSHAGDLFLVGDRAIVMTSAWSQDGVAARAENQVRTDRMIMPMGTPIIRLAEVDLSNGDIVADIAIEGNYLSAREVDGVIRVAFNAPMGQLPFLYPSSPNPQNEEQALEHNRRVIEESTIEQWLPHYAASEGVTLSDSGLMVDCDRMMIPEDFSGFGALGVITIDAANGLDPTDSMAVLSDGQTLYSSTERMVIATARWPEISPTGDLVEDSNYRSMLHSFDITDPKATRYVASADVIGHLLNQYSLSEHNGYLRVATTAGDPWWGEENTSESFITVLDEADNRLVTVGQVGGIGKTERIYSVRFMGDMGYVVTFRQTDPLYAIDLADPTNPTVLGELKIPGFSSYLHPVGDGLLLGVGQDATDRGQITGSQVSLFDVSDPHAPTRIATVDLGPNTHSSVEWDARAFTWWDDHAYIPVSWWGPIDGPGADGPGSAVRIIEVRDQQLVERGEVKLPVTQECMTWEERVYGLDGTHIEEERSECWPMMPEALRTVIIDDAIYVISDRGIAVAHADTLEAIEWLAFSA